VNDIVGGVEFALSVQLARRTIGKLVAVLQQEQQALVEGDVDRLETLASSKAELLRQLAGLADKHNRYLARQGLRPDRGGMKTWLAKSADAKVAAAWSESLQLAEAVRQLNQTNGAMITARLNHNQEALAALLGAASAASLYGRDGQTLRSSGGRPLGRV
jgi:flagella synthesis protein FlgN